MIGENLGSALTISSDGKVLVGIGMTLHQCGDRGNLFVAGLFSGGSADLCDVLKTDEGLQQGKIGIKDTLIAIDGMAVPQDVDKLAWVRSHILGEPGTAVELDLLHGDDAHQRSFRYQVSLVRKAADNSSKRAVSDNSSKGAVSADSNEELLKRQIETLLARIRQLEKERLDSEARHALREAEARHAHRAALEAQQLAEQKVRELEAKLRGMLQRGFAGPLADLAVQPGMLQLEDQRGDSGPLSDLAVQPATADGRWSVYFTRRALAMWKNRACSKAIRKWRHEVWGKVSRK
jgi:hypothetical protein